MSVQHKCIVCGYGIDPSSILKTSGSVQLLQCLNFIFVLWTGSSRKSIHSSFRSWIFMDFRQNVQLLATLALWCGGLWEIRDMFWVSTPRDLAIPQVYLGWESPHAVEKLSRKWHVSRFGGTGDVSVPSIVLDWVLPKYDNPKPTIWNRLSDTVVPFRSRMQKPVRACVAG